MIILESKIWNRKKIKKTESAFFQLENVPVWTLLTHAHQKAMDEKSKLKTDIWKNDKDFKEAIGGFIIAFSELEYGLAFLCSMTDFDLRFKDNYLVKYVGFTFEQKMRNLTEFINEQLVELKPIWDKLKMEIGQLNKERRFLAHGFLTYYLPHETITTHIKEKGQIIEKKQTLQEIKNLTNRLHHVNTGENGVNGEFHTLFTRTRINAWNKLVNDDVKIVYRVNSEIVSDWKGKSNA